MTSVRANRATPSLPAPGSSTESHTAFLRLIKECVEVHERRTGNTLDSFVRVRELVDLGLFDVRGQSIFATNVALLDRDPQTFEGVNNFTEGITLGASAFDIHESEDGDLIVLGKADIADPNGHVFLLDAYALANSDGAYTALILGLNPDQLASVYGGVYYGGVHCTQSVSVFNNNGAGRFDSIRVNGDYDSPSAVLSGQTIQLYAASAYDGSAVFVGAEIRVVAAENWSGSARGTLYTFSTIANGATALANRVRIGTNGLETVDGAVGTPAHTFINDTDCGWYRIGANNIGCAVAGAKVLDVAANGLGVTGVVKGTVYTVAQVTALAGPAAGWSAYVSDANAPAFGVAVAGGGAVTVPVYYDGANWMVG